MADKLYQKQNSFIDILTEDDVYDDVITRIRSLSGRLLELSITGRERELLTKACTDVLDDDVDSSPGVFRLFKNVIEEINRLSDEDLPRYLLYRYRYDVYPQQYIVADFPPCVQIEPTSICNYRCVFCYQTDQTFNKNSQGHMGHMPFELFRDIVDQTQGKTEAVSLASRGEPLLCPDIEQMLEYIAGKFLGLKINTNAWLLDEKMAHVLLQANINTIVFSADATEESLYRKLRVGGKLDRVLDNIRKFREIQLQHYPDSNVITRVSGVYVSEEQDLKKMQDFWGDLVDQVVFVKYNPWENAYDQPENDVREPCSDLWRRTFVWFDGKVNPCDVDYKSIMVLGNVREHSLESIWKSEGYARLREAHLQNQRSSLFPCNRCYVV